MVAWGIWLASNALIFEDRFVPSIQCSRTILEGFNQLAKAKIHGAIQGEEN
jgi:hypothetical protein